MRWPFQASWFSCVFFLVFSPFFSWFPLYSVAPLVALIAPLVVPFVLKAHWLAPISWDHALLNVFSDISAPGKNTFFLVCFLCFLCFLCSLGPLGAVFGSLVHDCFLRLCDALEPIQEKKPRFSAQKNLFFSLCRITLAGNEKKDYCFFMGRKWQTRRPKEKRRIRKKIIKKVDSRKKEIIVLRETKKSLRNKKGLTERPEKTSSKWTTRPMECIKSTARHAHNIFRTIWRNCSRRMVTMYNCSRLTGCQNEHLFGSSR